MTVEWIKERLSKATCNNDGTIVTDSKDMRVVITVGLNDWNNLNDRVKELESALYQARLFVNHARICAIYTDRLSACDCGVSKYYDSLKEARDE